MPILMPLIRSNNFWQVLNKTIVKDKWSNSNNNIFYYKKNLFKKNIGRKMIKETKTISFLHLIIEIHGTNLISLNNKIKSMLNSLKVLMIRNHFYNNKKSFKKIKIKIIFFIFLIWMTILKISNVITTRI